MTPIAFAIGLAIALFLAVAFILWAACVLAAALDDADERGEHHIRRS